MKAKTEGIKASPSRLNEHPFILRSSSDILTVMHPVIIVMVKAPRAGEAKTRLSPPLSASDAASLAACFAQDTVINARRVWHDVLIAFAPADGRATLEAMLPRDVHWLEQQGADLGARLDMVAAQAVARGFSPLIILGADSPTLPASFIATALDALTNNEADIALGPTEDGGYYLVGLRHPVAGLFQDIAWSTPLAYAQTAANAARLHLRLFQLPTWYDVDTPADLMRLRHHILTDQATQARALQTSRWLNHHA